MATGAAADPSALPLPPRTSVPLRRVMRGLGELRGVYEEFRDTTGPVTLLKLGPRWMVPLVFVMTSPEGARGVLGRHDVAFDKLTMSDAEIRRVLGPSLFTFIHEPWLARRRTLQPLFTRHHVASFVGHMGEAADELAARWRDGDGEVDLDAEMRRLTLAVLGRTLFGRPLEEDSTDLGFHIDRVLRYTKERFSRPVRAPRWLPTPARARMRESRRFVDALSAEVLDTRGGARSDLVDLLADARDPETGEPLTREELANELFVFLAAGHDTTATVLTAALWLLGRHPQIQDAVADEARAVPDPSLEDVRRLALTGRVVQEAMRLYPPAAALVRQSTVETRICGFRIPADSQSVVSIWAIHRDPDLWADPSRFDPDRFLPGQVAQRDRWVYLPFGAGARRCIGEHFAFTEAVIGLASLIHRFRVESIQNELPLQIPFTLTVEGPIPVRVQPRD
jgi:cytochrome P450